ncbi:MAG: CrcB family protein [Polyangiaceae bacterium]
MLKWVLLALAGAAGTGLRVWLSGVVQRSLGTSFPWGTAVVNVLGCLLFGIVYAGLEGRTHVSPVYKLVLIGGFMGAFTTFSTFVYEAEALIVDGRLGAAALDVLGQSLAGLAAMVAGLALGRAL